MFDMPVLSRLRIGNQDFEECYRILDSVQSVIVEAPKRTRASVRLSQE